eukprot:XP_019924034.1 PREDICTED: uncharacterized protein LOC105331068 [Crassostrea gigas]
MCIFIAFNVSGLSVSKCYTKEIPLANLISQCPQNRCPTVNIYVANGNMSDSDCSSRFRENQSYLQTATSGVLEESVDVMPADSTEPPSSMGAGSTYPFPQ